MSKEFGPHVTVKADCMLCYWCAWERDNPKPKCTNPKVGLPRIMATTETPHWCPELRAKIEALAKVHTDYR